MAEVRTPADAKGAFAAAIVLTLLAVAIDDGTIAWIIGPLVFGLGIFAIARAPMRVSLMTLMFFAFTLENPAELPANGQWQSPLFMVGALLLTHMNNPTGVRGLFFSGMDVFIVTLLVVGAVRRMSGSRIDTSGGVATPKPLIHLALVSLAGTGFTYLSGWLRGGDTSMGLWQVDRVIYLPVVFILFHWGLRGQRDYAGLGKVLLIAACVRSLVAMYVQATVEGAPDETGDTSLPYATSHHDSMLFAAAFVLLASLLLQRSGKWAVKLALLTFPILIGGMIANSRRMVWVQIILVFATLYLATPVNAMKRKVKRFTLYSSPLIVAYIAAGWSSSAGIFAPVKTIRSVVDSESDHSTLWRDIENYNLAVTIKQNPVFGTGYGHPFWEVIPLPAVGYPLEPFIPHNSVLGLWCYTGYIGFTAMTLLWVASVYFAMRAYHHTTEALDRTAALVSLGAILVYWVQCYGDMGLGAWTGVFTVAPAIAIAGKLSVSTGAWSAKRKSATAVEVAQAAAVHPRSAGSAS